MIGGLGLSELWARNDLLDYFIQDWIILTTEVVTTGIRR